MDRVLGQLRFPTIPHTTDFANTAGENFDDEYTFECLATGGLSLRPFFASSSANVMVFCETGGTSTIRCKTSGANAASSKGSSVDLRSCWTAV